MSTNTYTAIATQTLASAASSVTFSSIPATYTDLVLVVTPRGSSTSQYQTLQVQFNGDTGSNYSFTGLLGSGSSTASERASNQTSARAARLSTNYNSFTGFDADIIHIQNYANTSTYKTFISRGNHTNEFYGVSAYVSLWRSTAAINSITLIQDGAYNFVAGSTFNLYGVVNSDNFAKATGGMLFEDSTYWYHVFASSGTFTPKQSLTVDALIIGGGGGGNGRGGGGGAGGLLGVTSQSLSATGYSVVVGAGSAGSNSSSDSAKGTNSSFNSNTAIGGGGGLISVYQTTADGGSGGGGGSHVATTTGGSGTAGQGYGGGGNAGYTSSPYPAGGGGGAGAAGGNASGPSTPGIGGVGSSAYSSWGLVTGTGQNVSGTVYFSGGGAGGGYQSQNSVSGGYGGGGATGGNAGLANTGGGGGGWWGSTGGNGGSGLVIVRYAK